MRLAIRDVPAPYGLEWRAKTHLGVTHLQLGHAEGTPSWDWSRQ